MGCEDDVAGVAIEKKKMMTPAEELATYLALVVRAGECDDLLDWWKCHADTLPRLAVVARRVHSAPATEASAERMFSRMGTLLCAKRNKLDAARVSDLVVVAGSYKDSDSSSFVRLHI